MLYYKVMAAINNTLFACFLRSPAGKTSAFLIKISVITKNLIISPDYLICRKKSVVMSGS